MRLRTWHWTSIHRHTPWAHSPKGRETPFHFTPRAGRAPRQEPRCAFRYARRARTTVARSVQASRFLRVAPPRPGRPSVEPEPWCACPSFRESRSRTAMVDPQSAARPATVCSSGCVLCCCSCRRPPFRRRAPRAGQQRNLLARMASYFIYIYPSHYSLRGPPWWIRRARRAPPQCASPRVFCAAVYAAGRRSAAARAALVSREVGTHGILHPPRQSLTI